MTRAAVFDAASFFCTVRNPARCGPLKTVQVEGFTEVLQAAEGSPLAHAAYMLATAWHETARTMQPVREAYWLSEDWRKKHLRYWPWYGRGYVQLTWEPNYKRADEKLGLGGRLLADADAAMEPAIAAKIMRRGMEEGWFTGVRLRDVLPSKGVATRKQYMDARTIINGRDKADLIEDYAQWFERALRDGGWA
ncbi:carboxypeptidase [Sphingomonas soli]|uniref:carboxypeptidase n=1 Tax=Sphingomonas soli TaxID=266127 RepID=UPI000B199F4F|nr:carboxypeptidase [Sphingomonas soli]